MSKKQTIASQQDLIAELRDYIRGVPEVLDKLRGISDQLIELAYREGLENGGEFFLGSKQPDELWEASRTCKAMQTRK